MQAATQPLDFSPQTQAREIQDLPRKILQSRDANNELADAAYYFAAAEQARAKAAAEAAAAAGTPAPGSTGTQALSPTLLNSTSTGLSGGGGGGASASSPIIPLSTPSSSTISSSSSTVPTAPLAAVGGGGNPAAAPSLAAGGNPASVGGAAPPPPPAAAAVPSPAAPAAVGGGGDSTVRAPSAATVAEAEAAAEANKAKKLKEAIERKGYHVQHSHVNFLVDENDIDKFKDGAPDASREKLDLWNTYMRDAVAFVEGLREPELTAALNYRYPPPSETVKEAKDRANAFLNKFSEMFRMKRGTQKPIGEPFPPARSPAGGVVKGAANLFDHFERRPNRKQMGGKRKTGKKPKNLKKAQKKSRKNRK